MLKNTHKCLEQQSVLFIEVPSFQGSRVEMYHCIFIGRL